MICFVVRFWWPRAAARLLNIVCRPQARSLMESRRDARGNRGRCQSRARSIAGSCNGLAFLDRATPNPSRSKPAVPLQLLAPRRTPWVRWPGSRHLQPTKPPNSILRCYPPARQEGQYHACGTWRTLRRSKPAPPAPVRGLLLAAQACGRRGNRSGPRGRARAGPARQSPRLLPRSPAIGGRETCHRSGRRAGSCEWRALRGIDATGNAVLRSTRRWRPGRICRSARYCSGFDCEFFTPSVAAEASASGWWACNAGKALLL